MILLVDGGNTRIKWRMQAQGRIVSSGWLPTDAAAGFPEAWKGAGKEALPEAALVCSVAGDEVNQAIHHGLADVLGSGKTRIHWLASMAQGHGIVNAYQPPESLGMDRFAALVAARRHQASEDWVVVNVGTAMTADMLALDGRFLGGVIVPGPDLMLRALGQGTSRVTVREPVWGTAVPANTQAAVGQGIAWALWGAVEGMSRRLTEVVGRPPGVLLSGGARAIVRPLLTGQVVEVDELVLEGMAWIARDLGYDA
jgi:type III pantothenate kinase